LQRSGDVCREPLSKNGLAVIQTVKGHGEGLFLETDLVHSSGEWKRGIIPLLLMKRDMQGLGSAITYARRYGLSAMVGVAQDDDDGNDASPPKGASKPPAAKAAAAPKPSPVNPQGSAVSTPAGLPAGPVKSTPSKDASPAPQSKPSNDPARPLTEEELNRLRELAKKNLWNDDQFVNFMRAKFGTISWAKMTFGDGLKFHEAITKMTGEQALRTIGVPNIPASNGPAPKTDVPSKQLGERPDEDPPAEQGEFGNFPGGPVK
jgi:hypothetical protein